MAAGQVQPACDYAAPSTADGAVSVEEVGGGLPLIMIDTGGVAPCAQSAGVSK
jgi:hypothetical protein